MVSLGRISMTLPPRDWTSPIPSVTCNVCPTAWQCQAVRAHGAKRTVLTRMREGSSPLATTSNQTSPVKSSAGPLVDGVFGWISTSFLLLFRPHHVWRVDDACGVTTVLAGVGNVEL